MKSIEKDDMIGRLIREEGLIKAPPDLTERIMLQVQKAEKPVSEYPPLLSRRTWVLIAAAFIAVFIFSAWYAMPESSKPLDLSGFFKPAAHFFSNLQFSVRVTPLLMMVGSIVFASSGLLLVLDYYLHSRKNWVMG